MSLKDTLSVPPNWSYQNSEFEEKTLSEDSMEYLSVKNKLSGLSFIDLKRITRLQNPYVYHRYMIRKMEYEARGIQYNDKTLLHATGEHKVESIIQDNLDWRRVCRCKFGRGVSFSPYAWYANRECSRGNGRERAIIVAKVLVGNCSFGSQSQKLPPALYDTTIGNCGNVFVKYYDDEFYPEYAAYYTV